jgi:hypothetical protein
MYGKFAEALDQIVNEAKPVSEKKAALLAALDSNGSLDSFQELLSWFDKEE